MDEKDFDKHLEDDSRDAAIERAMRLAESALSGATDAGAILREPGLVADFVTELAVRLASLDDAQMIVPKGEF